VKGISKMTLESLWPPYCVVKLCIFNWNTIQFYDRIRFLTVTL
jgi:hypothetical protein